MLIFSIFNYQNAFLFNKHNISYATDEQHQDIESELNQSVNDVLDGIDFEDIEQLISENNLSTLFGGKSFKEFIYEILVGEESLEVETIFSIILTNVKESLKSIISPLSIILVVILLCYMFNQFRVNEGGGVGEVIYYVCFSIVTLILTFLLKGVIENSKSSIESMSKQMNIIFPILISLISVAGGAATVKAYSPMFAFLTNIVGNIFIKILLPLFTISLILSFVGNLSQKTKLDKLNGFIGSLFKWIIGVTFAIFMGYLSIKGITAGGADGISIKATKYAIKNYIPMLGGYISDGFELVKAGGLLVKNATGFASIILLLSTIISPIVVLGVIQLMLKFLAGILEPIDEFKCSSLLYSVAKSLRLLVVIIIGVGLMYFITTYLIMCSAANFI